MKYFLFGIAFFILISMSAYSQTNSGNPSIDSANLLIKQQQRFFVNIHTGFAIGLGSTFKFYPDDVTSITVEQLNNQTPQKQTSYKSTSKGLGDGFRYGAGLAYIVNDFINLGFDFDYFRSTISRTRDSSFHNKTQTDVGTSEYTYHQRYTISYDATLLTLSPNITFKAISRPKFYIYNKVGAVVTFRPNSIQKNTSEETMHSGTSTANTDSSSESFTRYEWGIRKPALGFMGSVGAQLRVSKQIRAFAELQFSHIVFAVHNRVLTDYIVNGKNLTGTLPENEKVIEFKDAFSATQNGNPNEPSVTVVQRIPITYIGIQAGVAFRF